MQGTAYFSLENTTLIDIALKLEKIDSLIKKKTKTAEEFKSDSILLNDINSEYIQKLKPQYKYSRVGCM